MDEMETEQAVEPGMDDDAYETQSDDVDGRGDADEGRDEDA
jgi:hypothetical protein